MKNPKQRDALRRLPLIQPLTVFSQSVCKGGGVIKVAMRDRQVGVTRRDGGIHLGKICRSLSRDFNMCVCVLQLIISAQIFTFAFFLPVKNLK